LVCDALRLSSPQGTRIIQDIRDEEIVWRPETIKKSQG